MILYHAHRKMTIQGNFIRIKRSSEIILGQSSSFNLLRTRSTRPPDMNYVKEVLVFRHLFDTIFSTYKQYFVLKESIVCDIPGFATCPTTRNCHF